MTREEAIDVFEGLDELEAISLFYQRGGKADGLSIHRIKEASRMAIAALRAQQTLAKLDRSRWEACAMCDSAFANSELTTDNDLSYFSIGACEKGYRMLLRSGDGRPVEILAERWSDAAGWQTIGSYKPKCCPNCGRPRAEGARAELEGRTPTL